MYSVPPWPSLAASMAAYRLRSFSESESWNIRIECSISGLYVMGGRPLRGRDRPCYGYTIRTENREVIESAILSRRKSREIPGVSRIQFLRKDSGKPTVFKDSVHYSPHYGRGPNLFAPNKLR